VIPLLDAYPKEYKSGHNTLAPRCLLQHSSQQPSYGDNPDALQLMNGLRKCDILYDKGYTYDRVLFCYKEE
jgi:hypothetical protein